MAYRKLLGLGCGLGAPGRNSTDPPELRCKEETLPLEENPNSRRSLSRDALSQSRCSLSVSLLTFLSTAPLSLRLTLSSSHSLAL